MGDRVEERIGKAAGHCDRFVERIGAYPVEIPNEGSLAGFVTPLRHLIADDLGNKRNKMSPRNVFSKWNEVNLAINLDAFATFRDQQSSVVICFFSEIDCPEQ